VRVGRAPARRRARAGTGLLVGTVSAKPPAEGEPFHTDRLPYKRDGRGRLFGPDRLVAIDADGAVTDLGPGSQPVPSPDGRRLAHLADPDSLEFMDADLVVRDLDPAGPRLGPARRQRAPRVVSTVAWSRGGRLALIGSDGLMGHPNASEVYLGTADGELVSLTGTTELWPGADAGDWTYSPARLTLAFLDEDTLLALDQRGGAVQPIAVSATGVRRLSAVDGITSEAVPAADGAVYAILERPTHPQEVVRFGADGEAAALTSLNPYDLAEPAHFTIAGHNGAAVDVYALWAGDGPRPTVFAIHGGPHGAFMRGIYLDHHRLRDAGINVVWANPTGSTGYSRTFAQDLVGHWGELDENEWRTIRSHLASIGREATKLAVWGTSYGGYMSTWLAGHLENLSAAVIQAPVVNQVSMTGSSDIGYTFTPRGVGYDDPKPDTVADLDERVAKAWRNSPLRTYPNIHCPTLILVGDRDDRCPVSQAEELYTLLRHRNRIPVELVVYPGESHLIARHGKPRSRDDRQRRTLAWLTTHLGVAGK